MLSSIVSGLNPSALVCVQDSQKQTGRELLKAFIQQAVSKTETHTHIFCYENPVKRLKMNLKNYNSDHVHFHDCFSDPRGWLETAKQSTTKDDTASEFPEKETSICTILQCLPVSCTVNSIVIIDSLSTLILNIGFTQCYRELHSLTKFGKNFKVSQCVCLVHVDVLHGAETVLLQLDHLATSSISVEPPANASNGCPIATITHKKPGGKILKEVEYYSVDADNRITSQKLHSTGQGSLQRTADILDENSLPQDLTTFKLSLGHQEKQARSELVLPYVKTSKDKGGKVFYQPDAADDWDEEDPDDDLDI